MVQRNATQRINALKENFTLSVIIPCYNEQDNILNIVQKVRESGVKNQEIIIVDDKSTDATSAKLDDCKVFYIINPAEPSRGEPWIQLDA